MNRILHVATREFAATAITKGFIIGAFIVPAVILAVFAIAFPILLAAGPRSVTGVVAVIDPTARVAPRIADNLTPEAEEQYLRRQSEAAREAARRIGAPADAAPIDPFAMIPKDASRFDVLPLPTDADIEALKARLRDDASDHLAVVSIDDTAVVKPADQDDFGGYELFVRSKLDDRYVSRIERAIEAAIRAERLQASGLGISQQQFDALREVASAGPIEVTPEGERQSLGELRMLISFGFMFLIFLPVMMGGQFLLTTVIEEKSSRVVEVLLSAVSPMQLMAGKIIGQLAVGLAIMLIYGSIGGGALAMFKLSDMLGFLNVLYLLVFFLIAYFLIASLMAAVGAAVNDLREAQSLQTPIMLVLILPYILWMPISRNPSSTFSVIVSLLPIVNPFAMILRITSNEPPPFWQVALSILIGLASVILVMWAAAKVFRIGLLMYGKPPNFATLVKWVRMA